MAFTVGELAKLTGITVRALHHYDDIGLVVPSQRTPAGYRLYDDADVIRLQQVLLFRELGLPLDEIAFAIDQAGTREELLRKHREALVEKRARIDAMLSALDSALGSFEKGHIMQSDDVKRLFGDFDPTQYRMLIFGLGMVLIMIWKPRGLIGTREPSAFLKEKRTILGSFVKEGHG